MTGFARAEGNDDLISWAWEIRTVNGRSLDVRSRLPNGYESLDPVVRKAVAGACNRGNAQVNLQVKRGEAPQAWQVNEELLQQVLEIMGRLETRLETSPPRLDGLLALRGILEPVEEDEDKEQLDSRLRAIEAGLNEALGALVAMRAQEGARLLAMVQGHLDAIERHCGDAADCSATQPETLRARLREQLDLLLAETSGVSEERLAQELAVLVGKADVREELDRLSAHIAAARELLNQGGAVGRKLDFLCQEFNREANTLCSKSADVDLTRIGLDLKSAIEQLREQVQNIE
ncbi:YicC family protein [Pelagibius litoralis]|uniref:YicC family protein n=2 Tax=Pelagibius litoralis TaxID=374515 RepID=A0A967EZL2_9PROT|nr:YicC family protein [Pelagibius litoralis]